LNFRNFFWDASHTYWYRVYRDGRGWPKHEESLEIR